MIEIKTLQERLLSQINEGIVTNKAFNRDAMKFDVTVDFDNQDVTFWFNGSVTFTDESESEVKEINIREAGGQFPDFNMKFEQSDISKLEKL